MNRKITKIFSLLMIIIIASLFTACSGDTPLKSNSIFYGTWKSTQELMYSPDMTTSFNDYMYLSFSDDSLVIYIPAKGSSKSLPYRYEALSDATGNLIITENGTPHTVFVLINGSLVTFTGTGFSELEIAKGAPGAIQITKTSSSLDYKPEMKPHEGGEVSGPYTVTFVIDDYTFPNGEDSITTTVEAGTFIDGTFMPEGTGIHFAEGSIDWYLDNSATPFEGKVYSDMTLHLKWKSFILVEDSNKDQITYLVVDSDGLKAWNDASKNGTAATYNCELFADITLPEPANTEDGNWTSPFINTNTRMFNGYFDGNGYSISNLQNTTGTGLIEAVSAEGRVRNLSIVNSSVSGNIAGGISSYNYGTITDCYFEGTVSATTSAGGIAGQNNGVIEGCKVDADITGIAQNPNFYPLFGGIAGSNQDGYIIGCYSSGNISPNIDHYVIGGIAGDIRDSYVIACASDCTIGNQMSNSEYIGGIIGSATKSEVRACYFAGSYKQGNSLIDSDAGGTKSINNVSTVGHPGINPNKISSSSENTGCLNISEQYRWYAGTMKMNEEILEWNRLNPDYTCNYKYNYDETDPNRNPDLIPTK